MPDDLWTGWKRFNGAWHIRLSGLVNNQICPISPLMFSNRWFYAQPNVYEVLPVNIYLKGKSLGGHSISPVNLPLILSILSLILHTSSLDVLYKWCTDCRMTLSPLSPIRDRTSPYRNTWVLAHELAGIFIRYLHCPHDTLINSIYRHRLWKTQQDFTVDTTLYLRKSKPQFL